MTSTGPPILVERAVPAIRRERREAVVRGWLAALPDDTVRRSPVLSVFCAAMLMVGGDVEAVGPRLDDAERALDAAAADGSHPWADTEELRTLPSTIAIYRASLAQAAGDVEGTARHARRALDLAGPDDHLARGGAAGFLGLAAWARGDVSQALETFGEAVASLHAAGNLVDELGGTVVLADLWRAAGRPGTAREPANARCTGPRTTASPWPARRPSCTWRWPSSTSRSATSPGPSAPAGRRRPGGRAAVTESHFRHFVAMGLLAAAEGDLPAALEHLGRAERLYRPGFFPDVRPIPAMRARTSSRRASSPPRPTGRATGAGGHRSRPSTCASTTTSPWSGWSSRGTGSSAAPGTVDGALGLLDPLRDAATRPGGRGAWSRCTCSRPSRTTPWAGGRRRSRAWPTR